MAVNAVVIQDGCALAFEALANTPNARLEKGLSQIIRVAHLSSEGIAKERRPCNSGWLAKSKDCLICITALTSNRCDSNYMKTSKRMVSRIGKRVMEEFSAF
jgi:hypothetical protein